MLLVNNNAEVIETWQKRRRVVGTVGEGDNKCIDAYETTSGCINSAFLAVVDHICNRSRSYVRGEYVELRGWKLIEKLHYHFQTDDEWRVKASTLIGAVRNSVENDKDETNQRVSGFFNSSIIDICISKAVQSHVNEERRVFAKHYKDKARYEGEVEAARRLIKHDKGNESGDTTLYTGCVVPLLAIWNQATNSGVTFTPLCQSDAYSMFTLVPKEKMPACCILGLWNNMREALGALAEAGLAHNDVKLENILVENDGTLACRYRLVDIEYVCALESECTGGTPSYVCPRRAKDDIVSSKSDAWSFALMIHAAVTRELLQNYRDKRTPYCGACGFSFGYFPSDGDVVYCMCPCSLEYTTARIAAVMQNCAADFSRLAARDLAEGIPLGCIATYDDSDLISALEARMAHMLTEITRPVFEHRLDTTSIASL